MKLTKKQKELFVETFVENELDILETYTQEDLINTMGKDIPELADSGVVNWKDIECYLIDSARSFDTVEDIVEGFGDSYNHILFGEQVSPLE